MSVTRSPLGIYVRHGETVDDDTFYHEVPGRRGEFFEVRNATVFKPRIIKVELDVRDDWKPVGQYGDKRFDTVWATPEFLVKQ